jgi:endonuclease/exonuclease/phosphatase family metal-dependent hydrolase
MARRFRTGWRAAAGLALVALVLGGTPAGAEDGEPSAAVSLQVMDWNIAGEHSTMSDIASVVRGEGIDIVTVQEIHRRVPYDGVDQVQELADELGWHISRNTHFGPADQAGPCDCDGPACPWDGTEAGNAILTRFPIERRVTRDLPHDDAHCQVHRSLAGVLIDVNGTMVHVFTSHFTPGGRRGMAGEHPQPAEPVGGELPHPYRAPAVHR